MGLYEKPVWGDPPPVKKRRYETVLQPLMDSPGRWAVIGEYTSKESAYQAALNLRKRKYRIPWPEHTWFFESEGKHVHACYEGVDKGS